MKDNPLYHIKLFGYNRHYLLDQFDLV